ncbi:hypothetical protein [Parasphingorhabdus sp.]|uniref:hypothetical protein n=1 Tax=Parasphingorhabdus sp. TaxID=2709688 RepID=UPI003BB12113
MQSIITDNSDWWIPGKKVGIYVLGSNIHDTEGFLTDHILQNQFAEKTGDQITHCFDTPGESYSISVEAGVIVSITCYREFLFNGNVIGTTVSSLTDGLVDIFGNEKAEFYRDTDVEYDNGDIQHNVNFDDLNMFVTVDQDDVILSVSTYFG